MLILPPLSLYVHIPWCVQKCPYCDFNSHAQKDDIPETEYIEHLLTDLRHDLAQYSESIAARPLHSIFIGGGTPSLFSPDSIGQLLEAIKQQIPFSADIEMAIQGLSRQPVLRDMQRLVSRGFRWAYRVLMMINCNA